MTREDKLEVRTLIVWVALVPLTVLVIYLLYDAHTFARWPWLRASILLSTLTCVWPYASRFRSLVGPPRIGHDTGTYMYGFFTMLFQVFLVYPGWDQLRLFGDGAIGYLCFILGIIHGIGFRVIEHGIEPFAPRL